MAGETVVVMVAAANSPTDRYRGRRIEPVGFWLRVLAATIGRREIPPLVRARLRGEQVAAVCGLQHLPASGALTLAVNHYNGRASLDVAAAVLHAVGERRPDLVRDILFIVGQVQRDRRGLPARLFTRASDWVFWRWARHAQRIPLRNSAPSPVGLRGWSGRNQPVFVFPEGKARLTFGAVRHGSGRWLAAQAIPTVPVAVWWVRGEGWHVRVGRPLRWSNRPHLHDTQLALGMAALLPLDLAPAWQADLARVADYQRDEGQPSVTG
ncbi:MAG: hypothetical protein MUF38_15300 [Anaerolineae bacterium]|nr:hypothetical protein [Anaerolineae bacterium]